MYSPVLFFLLLCSVCCQLGASRTLTENGNSTNVAFANTRKLTPTFGIKGIRFADAVLVTHLVAFLVVLGVSGKQIFDIWGESNTCKRCMKTYAVNAGPIEDACVSDATVCQNYFDKMQQQCNAECPKSKVMKPVYSYLYEIRQQEADQYFNLIETADSKEALAPAVEYAKEVKALEIARGFRFGKKLSTKITKAIEAKEAVLAKQN